MLLVLAAFIALLLIGMPVAFAIGIAGCVFFMQHTELPATIPIQLTISQTQNFALLAVPLFILAGNLMNHSGITQRLLDLATVLTGRLKGGLAQVSIALATLMGGVSGSCIADAAMQTRMLGAEMVKRGFSRGYAAGVLSFGSLMTPIIPPGIGFILYGTVGQVSIGRLFAAGILALVSTMVHGQAKHSLKFNHVLGPKEPYHEGFLQWAKAVEARTKGGLKIDVFHSAQLGKEEDILEQIRQGANIGQNTDSARMGNYVPGIAVMNGPYFAETLEDVAKLRKAPTVVKWNQELATKFGFKVLSFNWVQGYRHFFTNKPIRQPADLKGLRIRTPPAPIWQESIRALGATPVAMAFTEMYPGLQQRAIDGVELVYNNIPAGRFYEVLKFASETKHIMLINFEVVSAKWFDSLPKDYQQILVEECDKAGEATSRQIFKLEAEVEQQLKARGMTIVKDPDLAAFRKAGEKAYEVLKIKDAKDAVYKEIGKK